MEVYLGCRGVVKIYIKKSNAYAGRSLVHAMKVSSLVIMILVYKQSTHNYMSDLSV